MLRCSRIEYGHSSLDNQSHFPSPSPARIFRNLHWNSHIQQISSYCVCEWTFPLVSYLNAVHLFWIVYCVCVFMLWFIVTSHVTELICIKHTVNKKWLKEQKTPMIYQTLGIFIGNEIKMIPLKMKVWFVVRKYCYLLYNQ